MKKIQKSDLKEGQIYKANNIHNSYIFKATNNLKNVINVTSYKMFFKDGDFNNLLIFSEATLEEKHWLETCIKADQFVSYEEAVKTFIPEYVECISLTYPNMKDINFGEIGRIYKVSNYNHSISDMTINEHILSVGKERFKPSTKEAYDAQFVVKEPEFVLPEKWYIKARLLNDDQLQKLVDYLKILNKSSIYSVESIKKYFSTICSDKGSHYVHSYTDLLCYSEITFDQFKQYVLKENTTIIEKPKVVFEEPKDKVLKILGTSQIIKVECAEGGVYKIGDKITVFTHNSPNKGKVFTIEKFRWSKDKSKICAITEIHKPNGIGLNLIELYVEPKVKVTHNFKIGDKILIVYDTIAGSGVFIIENIEGNRLIINNETGTLHNMHKSVLAKNAKLVEAKQELSLLEQAKLKYPIGTKIISPTSKSTHIIKGDIRYGHQNSSVYNYIFGNDGGCTLYNSNTNQWAEIVDDFVLPEKWCVQVNPENQNFIKSVRDRSCSFTFITSDLILPDVKNSWYCYGDAKKRGFTEITLEQFKKHVLKNE